MIHSFAITNYLGDRIKLDLREPEVSGFLIKSVTGLGPVKATVNTTEVVTNDGSMFNSARLSQRNIVFQIVFVDTVYGETIEDVRQKSYKYFPAKKNVENPSSDNKEEEFLLILEIPKIGLKRGVYSLESDQNTIEKNVAILKESSLPQEVNGNVVLAAHNGTARISYFINFIV